MKSNPAPTSLFIHASLDNWACDIQVINWSIKRSTSVCIFYDPGPCFVSSAKGLQRPIAAQREKGPLPSFTALRWNGAESLPHQTYRCAITYHRGLMPLLLYVAVSWEFVEALETKVTLEKITNAEQDWWNRFMTDTTYAVPVCRSMKMRTWRWVSCQRNEAKLIETKIGACLKIPRSRTKKNVPRQTTKTKMNYGLTCFETRLARPACPARCPATVVPGHGVLVLDWHCRRFLTFLIVSRWLLFLVVCSGHRRPSPNSRFHLKRHNSKFANTNTCTSCDFILA